MGLHLRETEAGAIIGATAGDKVGFFGSQGNCKRTGSAQAVIGAATYAAPSAVPANSAEITAPTTAEFNAALATLASVRTQLIALAADVATHKTLNNELRAVLLTHGLIAGA